MDEFAQSELFYTDSENDPAQIQKMPGATRLNNSS
jgi:hypothetical protein